MKRLIVTTMALGAVSSCAISEEDGVENTTPIAKACAPSDCGGVNDPTIDGVVFWQLYPPGVATPQDVVVESVTLNGANVRLRVGVNDQLRAVSPLDFSSNVAVGTGLIGTEINLRVKGAPFRVRIDHVTPTNETDEAFWVGSFARIEAYDFSYVPLDDAGNPKHVRPTPLCQTNLGQNGERSSRAIVFGGDLYDPTTKTVAFNGAAMGPFNIACKDGAPYKMHVVGYTSAAHARLGTPPASMSTIPQRQTLLKAWTADYCGTGRAFTHHGEPLRLSEALNQLPPISPYISRQEASMEAIWGPNGAVCLEVPRLSEENDLILEEIARECADVGKTLGRCTTLSWPGAGHVRTGNPVITAAPPEKPILGS